MKNTMLNRKLTVSILTVLLVICAVPDAGAGFFDDLFGVIEDVVETVATVATTVVDVAVAVVDVAVGVVDVAVGVVDLTVSLALTLVGHTGCVLATAFDPYGATLASGGCDYEVLLWDILDRWNHAHAAARVRGIEPGVLRRRRLHAGQWNGGRTAASVDPGNRGSQDDTHRAYRRCPEYGFQSFGSPPSGQRECGWDHPAMEYGNRRAHQDPGRTYRQRLKSRVPS